ARAALLAGPGAAVLAVSWSQLAVLIGLSVVALLLEKKAQVGLTGSFSANGLPYALFSVPLVLLASWAIASLGRRGEQTLSLMVVTLSAALSISALVWLLGWGVQFVPRGLWRAWLQWGLYYLPPSWLALAAAVAGVRLVDLPLRWRGAAVAIALALIAYPLATVWIDRRLWTERHGEDAAESRAGYDAVAREDALYLQPKLL